MQLFISYASEERPIADALAVRLRTEGHRVFLDQDDLPEGEGYDARIRYASKSWITLPNTSVKRKSRPAYRYVNFS